MQQCETELNLNFSPNSLLRFIKSTALGYIWEPNGSGGRYPFLCPADFEELKIISHERTQGSNFIDLSDCLEMVGELKTSSIIHYWNT